MELTRSNTSLTGNLTDMLKSGILPLGIIVLVAMMVLPLPVFLLDVFFVSNILISLVILMVAMHTFRPLDFSSFPNLLLIATVLRLALNVASTRVVLGQGHTGNDAAGQIIEAFGNFIVSGNYAVGIFVFIILVIINLVVITKGAGRVSEVSARFTLDAMPGKQMAIDADLNAGVLTAEEATSRREEIAQEADFYGSMDGASKFVKGDAIASILILAINIIGGLVIGISQYDLPVSTAAETYILLSIGDGLVAQIPSLLLAISTAIIVTRVSSKQDMASHIGDQLSISRAWIPVSAVLLLIGFVPGMPNLLFIASAIVAATAGFLARRVERKRETKIENENEDDKIQDAGDADQLSLEDVTDYSPVSVQLGYGLVEMVDDDTGGPLVERITGIRKQVSKALGFIIPAVRIRDDLTLSSNQYRIRIGQTIVGDDLIYPDRKLAIPGDDTNIKLDGIEVKDPSFGMMILLLAIIFYIFQQNKTLVAIENEILNVKSKINSLVNRTDDTTSDISSLSSRISNLSGVVSEANTVAEGTKKELSMLADGISNETVFNEAIDLARKGGSVDDIVKQTKLSKDQAETIVRFHGSKF